MTADGSTLRTPRSARWPSVGTLAVLVALLIVPWVVRKLTWVPHGPTSWRAAPVLVLGTPVMAILVLLPGTALLGLVARQRDVGIAARFGLVVVGAGLAWWGAMWLWVASPGLGRLVTFGIHVVASCVVVWRWQFLRRLLLPVVLAVGLAVGATVAVNGALFVHGGFDWGQDTAASVTYSTFDNQFPLVWADRIQAGADLREPQGFWPMADRPPLQTALSLPVLHLALNRHVGYQLVSSFLESLAIAALGVLLAARGLGGKALALAVGLIVSSLAVAYHLVFVWPKLLPAGLLLLALAVLVERRDRLDAVDWFSASTLVGLSAVAHPGGIFALPVLAGVLLRPRREIGGAERPWRERVVRPTRPATRWVALGLVSSVGPWLLYRLAFDRSRSLLFAWHLGGVSDPADRRGLGALVIDQIHGLGWSGWLVMRGRNLMTLLWPERHPGPRSTWAFATELFGWHPLWSGGILALMLPVLVVAGGRRSDRQPSSRRLAAAAIGSVALWVCVEFGPPVAPAVTHHGPLAAFLVVWAMVAETTVERLGPRGAGAIFVAQSVVFGLLWWPRGRHLTCGGMCGPHVVRSLQIQGFSVAMLIAALAGGAAVALCAFGLGAAGSAEEVRLRSRSAGTRTMSAVAHPG